MPRYRDVQEAIDWVDRSGVAPELEALIRPTGRGRPRQLSVRALLVGIKVAIDTAKTGCLTDIHAVLTQDLSREHQRSLGIRNPAGVPVSLFQVRRLFSTMTALLDPSPHSAAHVDDLIRQAQGLRLQSVLDRLLGATMPPDTRHAGSYAVDGTGIWSWSRGKRRTDRSADPDARWGHKTAKTKGQEAYFGYELHALVRVNALHQDPDRVPCLAERIVITPAATNPVTAVLPALTRLHRDGQTIRDLIADRGYTYKTNWTHELFTLGIDPVLDLHATQYGPRGTHQGARIVTGVPHCPATPTALDTIQRPERLADSPILDTFITDITRRQQWAFRRVAGPDDTGKERYECPARAGTVRCPLHKPSMTQPLHLPKALNPPSQAPPPCCTQRTITVPGDIDPKSRQRHYWGSRDWIRSFRRRSRVEGWFGNLKNDSTEALNRGAFRVMGIAKTSLMLAIYAATTNLRLLRHWTTRQEPPPKPAGPASASSVRSRRHPQPVPTRITGRPPDPQP